MPAPASVFKAYDVRGVVPDELDSALSRAVGAAFARFTGAERLLVARDMRPSGPELVAAFVDGATAEGAAVVDLGLASTDLLYFASGHLDAPGAMFTASHNPARYNGIKLCLAGARPVGQDTGLAEIQRMALQEEAGGGEPGSGGSGPGRVESMDLLDEYADHVVSFVDAASLRPLRAVADTANGLDGTFPNHPADPIQPENLVDLQARVRETGADVGLAFDGDADRVFLVDDQAEPLSGSITTALVAQAMLAKHPGATILYNLICSKVVPEVIAEAGGTPVRTRVGHSFIKAVMAETGAVFGGEHSGHYYFRDNYRADSGSIAALVVLEVISKAGVPLSELRQPFDRYAASGEVNIQVDDPRSVVDAMEAAYAGRASLDRPDGLTADLGDWWFNLRPSNTEPLLRLNLEAGDRASCDRHVAEVLSALEAARAGTPGGDGPGSGGKGASAAADDAGGPRDEGR